MSEKQKDRPMIEASYLHDGIWFSIWVSREEWDRYWKTHIHKGVDWIAIIHH